MGLGFQWLVPEDVVAKRCEQCVLKEFPVGQPCSAGRRHVQEHQGLAAYKIIYSGVDEKREINR